MANVRAFIAAGLAVVAVILVFLGLFSNGWQTGEIEEKELDIKQEINVGLREVETTTTFGGFSQTAGGDIAQAAQDMKDLDAPKEQVDFFDDLNNAGFISYIILWVAVLVGISAIVFAILGAIGKMAGKNGMILGFAAGGSILLAAILYAVMSPSTPKSMEGSMWDEASLGWAFYVVIIGGVLQCVGGGMMIGIKKGGAPAPGAPIPGQPPAAPAPAPGSYEEMYGTPPPQQPPQTPPPY